MKKLLVAVFLFVVSPAWALTFKSDGSVVQKDGTVVTKTTQERYAEALSDYRAGRTVSGFPTAKKPGGLFGVLGAKVFLSIWLFWWRYCGRGCTAYSIAKQY